MNRNRKRILVVDDEPKIVEVVTSYLEKSGYAVRGVFSGKEAYESFEREKPSLVILDWMLPDTTGEEICRTLRQKSDVPIIMLTAKVEEEDILRGLQIGADDYVTKPFSPRQLVARVEAVLRRTEGNSSPVLSFRRGELIVDMDGYDVMLSGRPAGLTPNEFRIVGALARHPNKVFTREELIAIVSGDDFNGFDRVIDTHIKNIRQKIETDTRNPEYILTVHGVGYKFGGD
ncbi:response regulator transcription factor [Caproiciproducens sp. CPB-2]|uniref:response regulator transcription factor n=1 Tax=Caproiciproducens sp. CPB-2 TaxID=3030017 RepID=UPI0023D9F9A6|nr:response regulator transcription factor [Caproiciproducens sp. CPB-2]MDF1493468.1 response regulator transcription factor [Caproiciproducens sp. CPB-2]